MFDGTSWTTRDLNVGDDHAIGVHLFAEPDGKGLVAAAGNLGNLWRWRENKWKSIHYLAGRELSRNRFYHFPYQLWSLEPTAKGVWLFQPPGLRFIPWDNKDLTMSELIAELDSDKFSERESATNQLVEFGRAILDNLRAVQCGARTTNPNPAWTRLLKKL